MPSKKACEEAATRLEMDSHGYRQRDEVADYLRTLHEPEPELTRRSRDLESAAQTAMEALAGILLDVPGVSRTRPDLVVAHDALAEALSRR